VNLGTSPAPRALVPFHAESSLWPYPRAPLDDRDDIVELDFADTSALSDVDAFERRRQHGRNAKHSKKDKAKEREEIERSWDTPGNVNPVHAALRQAGDKLPTTVEFIDRKTPPRLGNLLLTPEVKERPESSSTSMSS
jgi:hypothetical protein